MVSTTNRKPRRKLPDPKARLDKWIGNSVLYNMRSLILGEDTNIIPIRLMMEEKGKLMEFMVLVMPAKRDDGGK